jgi:prepilin-type N-terminal cleavage/methylation domain-containing protein
MSMNLRTKSANLSLAAPSRGAAREATTRERGFSLLEVLIVVAVTLIVAAIVIPNIYLAVANIRLRASAGDLAGLMQQARILAAKNNANYAILYGTINGRRIAYIDLNGNSTFDTGEPVMQFSGTAFPAAGAPTGGGGQPTAYVLVGDSGNGSFDNVNTLGYTGRGLPCNYDTSTAPATCSTPPAKYFTYYITDTRAGAPGWAAVVVTKSGRAKIISWNGTTWN